MAAVVRPSFTKRGRFYSEYGTTMRCVRPDESSQTLVLHYKQDGTCVLGFSYRKTQYLIPAVLVLRALADCNDREIFDAVVQGDHSNTFLMERVELMLSEHANLHLYSREECLAYLGNRFRVVLDLPDRYSDVEAGTALLQQVFFVHLGHRELKAKFNCLIMMTQKLYALVSACVACERGAEIGSLACSSMNTGMNHR